MYQKAAQTFTNEALKATGIGLTVRILGKRAASVVSPVIWLWSAYEGVQAARTYFSTHPIETELKPFAEELGKWGNAVSCLGRTPYVQGQFSSQFEGGAINALGLKKLCTLPTEYYGIPGTKKAQYNHRFSIPLTEEDLRDRNLIPPDPLEAQKLIREAAASIEDTVNLLEHQNFDEVKEQAIKQLHAIDQSIEPYVPGTDYTQPQQELNDVVKKLLPLEMGYMLKVRALQEAVNNERMGHVVGATVAGLTALAVGKFLKKK